MSRANIDAFRQIGDQRIHFKAKITLILCIFSGSDVGSNWRLLYSLLRPTTKHLNRLIWDILSSPGPESTQWWTDDSTLRVGLRIDGLVNQLSWEGPAQNYVIMTGISELRFEKGDFKIRIKKKHWLHFYHYRMYMYTHFQYTIMFKQLEKWIFHQMTPLRMGFGLRRLTTNALRSWIYYKAIVMQLDVWSRWQIQGPPSPV